MAIRHARHDTLPWRAAEVTPHAHIRLSPASLARRATFSSAEVSWTSTHATTATSATYATAIGTSVIGITMTTECQSDMARVLRPSTITDVNATTIGTTHVTARTIAIVRMADGLTAIANRGTVAAIRERCLPVASTCLAVMTGNWYATRAIVNTG
jgi:hypothetical protein